MKKCYFRSFDVGIGDCNVIRIVDGDKQYSIMVDCGRFTTPVKDYVINVLNKHIDILIATHIDGDHVSGLGKMLTEISDIKIDHIWYNVYRRTAAEAPVDLTEQQEQVLEWIKKELPSMESMLDYGDSVFVDLCVKNKMILVTDDIEITGLNLSIPVLTA